MSDATHNPNFAGFRATAIDAITNMSHAHGQLLAQRDAQLAQVTAERDALIKAHDAIQANSAALRYAAQSLCDSLELQAAEFDAQSCGPHGFTGFHVIRDYHAMRAALAGGGSK